MLTSPPNLLTVSRIPHSAAGGLFYVGRRLGALDRLRALLGRRHHGLCRRVHRPHWQHAVAVRPLARPGCRQAAGGLQPSSCWWASSARRCYLRWSSLCVRSCLRPARVHGRGQRRPAGKPPREVEDGRTDGGHRLSPGRHAGPTGCPSADRLGRALARGRPDAASPVGTTCRPGLRHMLQDHRAASPVKAAVLP